MWLVWSADVDDVVVVRHVGHVSGCGCEDIAEVEVEDKLGEGEECESEEMEVRFRARIGGSGERWGQVLR